LVDVLGAALRQRRLEATLLLPEAGGISVRRRSKHQRYVDTVSIKHSPIYALELPAQIRPPVVQMDQTLTDFTMHCSDYRERARRKLFEHFTEGLSAADDSSQAEERRTNARLLAEVLLGRSDSETEIAFRTTRRSKKPRG